MQKLRNINLAQKFRESNIVPKALISRIFLLAFSLKVQCGDQFHEKNYCV